MSTKKILFVIANKSEPLAREFVIDANLFGFSNNGVWRRNISAIDAVNQKNEKKLL